MSTNPPNNGSGLAPVPHQQATLKDLLDRATPALRSVLPKHLSAERLVKIALAATARDRKLMACTPQSVLQSVMQASQLGLEPNSSLGGAYLVPYGNQCTLIVGYRGLIDLARRSGQIQSIEARVVHEKEKFRIVFGIHTVLEHEPLLDGSEPGKMVAVYAVAHLKDGGTQVEVMTYKQVVAIRDRSTASGNGPWVTDFEEMARKTVVRRLCKYLPLSVELADALANDERAERGEAHLDGVFVVEPEPDQPAELTQATGEAKAAPAGPAKTVEDVVAKAKAGKAAKASSIAPTSTDPGPCRKSSECQRPNGHPGICSGKSGEVKASNQPEGFGDEPQREPGQEG